MGTVALEHVSVTLSGETVLRDVNLVAEDGELLGIVGPSGSGKTTLLRVVAGLTEVASGTVRFAGVDVTGEPPAARNIGMVFQTPALFPHRNVRRNVSFPLEVRHEEAREIRRRVDAEVRALHLEQLLKRRPSTLSAGEEQLVQIARAMVRRPSVLLLDEPFARLDESLKHRMRAEIGLVQRGYGVTTMMTTNDPKDAVALPDRLAVLEEGRLVQVGTRDEVRRAPATLNAALTTGMLSTIPVHIRADSDGFWLVRDAPGGGEPVRHRVWSPTLADRVGDEVILGVRPEDMTVADTGHLVARVERVIPGSATMLWCDVAGRSISVRDPGSSARVGDTIRIRVDYLTLFDATSGYAIA